MIESKNLSYSIDKKKIIDKITIHVKNKTFLGVIGPNGSGKSTFLKNLYRVYKPTAGEILLEGKSIDSYTVRESAKQISALSQQFPDFAHIDVLDMVLMGRYPYKKAFAFYDQRDREIALDSLDKVGLKDFQQRKVNELSGGELQRVMIARAICQEARILIMDEPTNHLDIRYQLQVLGLVKSLGITVISAIHDLNMALRFCDEVVVLNHGKIYSIGDPKEVIAPKMLKEVFGVDGSISIGDFGYPVICYRSCY